MKPRKQTNKQTNKQTITKMVEFCFDLFKRWCCGREDSISDKQCTYHDVVVQFCPWFKFYFLSFLGRVIYDDEFETKGNIISTKDKIEPQHI